MHEYSLPKGDRDGFAKPESRPRAVLSASVLALATGGYFRNFRRGGTVVTAKTTQGAKLFMTSQRDAMEKVRRKLQRLGMKSESVDVQIRIGDRH